jgi:hypothetical protein
MTNACAWLLEYAMVSTLGCLFCVKVIRGLRQRIRYLEAGLEASERLHKAELAALIADQSEKLSAIMDGPEMHVCNFDTRFHPVRIGSDLMVFCSEPGCWAARLVECK